MYRRNLIVSFNPIKSNSVILPDSFFRQVYLFNNGCVALHYHNAVHYTSWAPYGSSISETEIGMNSIVANAIGLKEGVLVKCSLITDPVVLDSMQVSVASQKDWDMLEVSRYRIQSTILDQTKVVNTGQNLVIWINKVMTITVKIDCLNPNTLYGRLVNNTEVIVAPYTNENPSKLTKGMTNNESEIIGNCQSSCVNKITSNKQESYTKSVDVVAEETAKNFNLLIKNIKNLSPVDYWFRVIPSKWENSSMCNLYLTKYNLPDQMDINEVYTLTTQDEREYFINVRIINDAEIFPKNQYKSIEMNEILMKHLGIQPFERIAIRRDDTGTILVNCIEVAPCKPVDNKEKKIIEYQLKEYILENTKLYAILINQHQIIKLSNYVVSAHIYPESFKHCLIDSETLRNCQIKCMSKVKDTKSLLDDFTRENNNEHKSIWKCKHEYVKLNKYEEIIYKIADDLRIFSCLNEENDQRITYNILLIGSKNSGRTTICKKVLSFLAEKPYCCYGEIFNCVNHKGRKPESIHKDLRDAFERCQKHYPSILILDNVDVLTQIITDQTQDAMYYNKVSHTIADFIAEYSHSFVTVIVTVTSYQNLNKNIYQSHGWHLFQSIFVVPNLNKVDREKIIRKICTNYKLNPLNPSRISHLTEGYQIGDLVQFMERTVYYAHRDNPNSPQISNINLGESISKTSAYCMAGIEQNTENMSVNDSANSEDYNVAGMDEVTSALEEVIVWPLKYPLVFDSAPIGLPMGVLLYGPPGTGKTHLMVSLAKLWHLRIISVKGPELLAKYIGQSEENVRNAFKRARAAKPCILFFDEFDSLAPRRGHDSTGVTDRVVNQLLTELDGIEEQKGVIIVAATCRPELIDPALLRPGRIDLHVECKVPNQLDRLAILKSLAKTLNLDGSVNLDYFSENSDNYTGADIQSILTTANMIAVKEYLIMNHKTTSEKILIGQNHLLRAFMKTRPSLSKDDIFKYKLIYSRFNKKERIDMEAQKVSLA